MQNPFRLRRRATPGITSIERVGGDFVVWNLSFSRLERPLVRSPRSLARRITGEEVSGLAIDLTDLCMPSVQRTEAIARFVDEIQLRGLSVVLYSVPAAFLVAVQIEGSYARFATHTDLADAVRVLHDYDVMRRECTSDRGRRINQLRMPATALSLAPLCLFIGDRLEAGGLEREPRVALLRESYAALLEILETAYSPGEGDVSASVAVHDGRATVTILDSGKPHENGSEEPGPAVDRKHRFRILDRHNAIVLEKDLG